MTTPSVSVVIPNYNGGRFIAEAIESALSQTLPALEVIVVDDGSTDTSHEVIQRYADQVVFLRLGHTGRPGRVRNEAIRVARGDFIAFLDSDDVWLPKKLEIQTEYLYRRPDVAMVHSNLQVVDVNRRYLRFIFLHCPGSQGLSDDRETSSFVQLVEGDSNVWTSSVLVRRASLEAAGGFAESLTVGEDYHLWIRIAHDFKVGYLEEPLALHRKHGANTGVSSAQLIPPQEVLLWNEILQLYPDLRKTHGALIHAKSLFHYVVSAIRCIHARHYLTAVRLLLVGAARHLTRTRYAHVKRTAQKYLEIRRLHQQRVPR